MQQQGRQVYRTYVVCSISDFFFHKKIPPNATLRQIDPYDLPSSAKITKWGEDKIYFLCRKHPVTDKIEPDVPKTQKQKKNDDEIVDTELILFH